MRKGIMISIVILIGFLFLPQAVWSEDDSAQQQPTITVQQLQEQILQLQKQLDLLQAQLQTTQKNPDIERMEVAPVETELEKRVDAIEKKSALDRLNFSGEIRVANDTLHGKLAPYFDGLQLQRGIVDSLFFMQMNPGVRFASLPGDENAIYQMLNSNISQHYVEYLQFVNNITFDDLKGALSQFTPEQQMGLMQMLLPATARPEQDYDNSILYTTRLRLNVKADIAPNLSFAGRLSMYKTWGDSSAVQVFNGQANSINIDGSTTTVPNGDAIRVDRAYFDWNHIGGSGLYVSLGRRPSSGGPPTEIRENRLRGGTPLGHVVDFQFDGVTVGYVLNSEKMPGAIYRFCYGLGYESGFGSGEQLKAPADRLKDVHFGGVNLDLLSTEKTFVQTTVLRAWNVTDGFNSLVVMPVNPVTGIPSTSGVVTRFTPSRNLGNIDLAAGALERKEGPVHMFASLAGMWSHPENVTTPFGGLFSDPFAVPQSHQAWSVYTGVRYDFPNGKTQIGGEYNYGSKYWFNFTQAADDLVLSKLATRGDVFEAYLIQEFGEHIQLRASGIQYLYDYSGSGWHLGEPKKLDSMPILGFPTYEDVLDLRLAMTVKF